MSESHITAYGDLAERFEEAKERYEAECGVSVDNTDMLRELLRDSSY